MLNCHFRNLSKNYCSLLSRGYTTSHPEKWDLLSAVCLERRPIITPDLNDLEKAFQSHLSQLELERSYKSDHEIQHEADLKQAELQQKGDADLDMSLKQTAQDFADASLDELNQFKFASRSRADLTSNSKSLGRKLDKHLVLLVKQQIGDKSLFLLPQALRQDGETLRQTADRILSETCGRDVKTQVLGNAPSGFYKYKYPKKLRETNGSVGAKVFMFFARHNSGQLPDNSVDYKWLDRSELKTELPSVYHRSVAQFLIDEN